MAPGIRRFKRRRRLRDCHGNRQSRKAFPCPCTAKAHVVLLIGVSAHQSLSNGEELQIWRRDLPIRSLHTPLTLSPQESILSIRTNTYFCGVNLAQKRTWFKVAWARVTLSKSFPKNASVVISFYNRCYAYRQGRSLRRKSYPALNQPQKRKPRRDKRRGSETSRGGL